MQNNSIKIHRNSIKIQESTKIKKSIKISIEIPKQSRIHQNSRYNNTNNNKMTTTVDRKEGLRQLKFVLIPSDMYGLLFFTPG